jgi:hypothetical protein
MDADHEQRPADAWASIDRRSEPEFPALSGNSPSCRRTAPSGASSHPDLAVPLYPEALDRGPTGVRPCAGR